MLKELIHEQVQEARAGQAPRKYLGASSIGNQCERAIWYGYRNYPREDASKLLITFEIGKSLEAMLIEMIAMTPITLMTPMQNNNFLSFAHESVPELSGHLDGLLLINGEHYVLEIKTANAASYAKAAKVGIRAWRPEYYDQMQTYMGLSTYTKAICLVINKDSSDLYEEIVHFDQMHYELLVSKAARIVKSDVEPERLSSSPMFFICKMCSYHKVCHGC